MNRFSRVFFMFTSFACLLSASSNVCCAHFPWLVSDDEGHARLFFSESPAERDYHLPESVAAAEVWAFDAKAEPTKLTLATLEEEDFAGRRSDEKIAADSMLSTSFSYGIYHGTLLQYYARHLRPIGTESPQLPQENSQKLDASLAPTKTGMELTVTWEGEPLKGASVTIIDADGEQAEEKTDAEGKASFATAAQGLTGFVIAHVVKSASGELEGTPYTSESHYCTISAEYGSADKGQKQMKATAAEETSTPKQAAKYAPLPEAVASYGAAVSDGWLYVYSGHTGKAHDHSADNLSQDFRRLKLDGQSEWESLPMQTPLQGLPLVAHGGKLYRVGGLNATNAAGEEAVMHSKDEFACFDPATNEWTSLPALPEPRSSLDAVVLDGKLYVVGGWTLAGDSDGEWLEKAYVYDLEASKGEWKEIPNLPFQRRALALGHWDGKIIAMGGMDDGHDISQSVNCYDPATQEWSTLADFPGEGMSGFGTSAWNVDGKLYASGSDGIVYHLSDDGQSWIKVAELNRPRFFHRLLASSNSELLIIGGAPLDAEGHLTDIETVELK